MTVSDIRESVELDHDDRWDCRPENRPNFGRRPRSSMRRPAGGAVVYRGTGVAISKAPHGARAVSATVTLTIAAAAALITVWLGALAQARTEPAPAGPERLAVVQVHTGESLQGLAARVAPDAPLGHVVDRIKELNKLDSVAVDAGQTLIAPVG